MGKKQVLESINGQIYLPTKGNWLMEILMEREYINGKMVDHMMENGYITKYTDMVNISGQTVKFIKEM